MSASVSLLYGGVLSYHSKEIPLGLGLEGVNSFLVFKAEGACDLFSRVVSREQQDARKEGLGGQGVHKTIL